MVASTAWRRGRASGVDDLAGAARGLDLLAGRLGEAVGVHGQRLGERAAPEHLDRDALAGGEAGAAQRVEVDRRALVEARLEVLEVDGLGVRPERLERHRHLLVRAAQLAHPHVDRVLAALEAGPVLRAGASAVALVAAARRLAVARAVAAPDALAVLARAGGRREVVQADADLGDLGLRGLLFALLARSGAHRDFSSTTTTRCWTLCTSPRSCGESGRSTMWPMRRRPSVRSVSRWRWSVPLADLTWRIASVLTPGSPRSQPPRRAPPRPERRRWPRRWWRPARRRARARRRRTARAAWRSPPGGGGPGGLRSSP